MGAHVTPLDPEQLDAYLARIGYEGSRAPGADTLRALHRAHVFTVPFENIDIRVLERHITLSVDGIFSKIVGERRGGFCYEHNGLLAAALAGMGFDVGMLAAGVHLPDGSVTPVFDHMALRVELEEPWLADVGFGDSFIEPLRFAADVEQTDGRACFRLSRDGDDWVLWHHADDWAPSFRFTEQTHPLESFQPRCDWIQTSPESLFVQGLICSRATETGRITIKNDALVVTENGRKTETPLAEEDRPALLEQHFGIRL